MNEKVKRKLFVVAFFVYAILGMSVLVHATEEQQPYSSQTSTGARMELITRTNEIVNGATMPLPPTTDSRVVFRTTPISQQGENLYDEKIHWQLHSTQDVGDGLENQNRLTSSLYLSDSTVRRHITITASMYYDRSIYDTFSFTIDPSLPTMTVYNTYEVYFTQGVPQEALITVNTQNLPDGTYIGTIHWLPNGMYIAGWSESSEYASHRDWYGEYKLVRPVYGEIEIVNGIGTFTLISDYTFGNDVRMGLLDFGLTLENVWFSNSFRVIIRPVLVDIHIDSRQHQIARKPGYGEIYLWLDLYCMAGYVEWDQARLRTLINWTVTGMVEGDRLSPRGNGLKYLYIGSSTETRTIVVTISAIDNPELYSTITVYIDEDFEFIPTSMEVFLSRGVMTGIQFIALDDIRHREAIVVVITSDGYDNYSWYTDYLTFTVEGASYDDIFWIEEEEAIFSPGFDPTIRMVTITATSTINPDLSNYLNILVVPSVDYLPFIYIADIYDNTVILHSENIPDGFHQIYMSIRSTGGRTTHLYLFLFSDYLDMSWEYSELVEFVDGIGTITLAPIAIANVDTVLSDMDSHVLNLYWEAWIEAFGVSASGVYQFELSS